MLGETHQGFHPLPDPHGGFVIDIFPHFIFFCLYFLFFCWFLKNSFSQCPCHMLSWFTTCCSGGDMKSRGTFWHLFSKIPLSLMKSALITEDRSQLTLSPLQEKRREKNRSFIYLGKLQVILEVEWPEIRHKTMNF